MAVVIVACFLLLLCIYWIFTKCRKKYRFPSGPKGIPIFGNYLQLDMKRFAMDLNDIGKGYEKAYTVELFNQKIVVLKSYEIIRKALLSHNYAEVFSGRPPTFFGKYIVPKDLGMVSYSPEWASLRKLVFRGLKNYGTHMKEVEELVHEELKHVLSRIENEADKPIDPWNYITGYITSIIVMLLTGQHLKYDDPLLKLADQFSANMDILLGPGTSALMTLLPWIRHVPFGIVRLYQDTKKMISLLETTIHEERKENTNRKPCFMDFLEEQKNKGNLSDESFTSVFLDLLAAGTGTSRSSTYTLMLMLASRPDLQKKAQEEIDREIGTSRLPCAEDKQRLPFTQAILWETFRHIPVAPLAVPHSTMEDVEIGEYSLPKDTVVFYSVWNVLHDETFWKVPWEFNPSRFLDNEGNLVPPEDEKRQR